MFGILAGITSCCTKKYCPNADEFIDFHFFNFEQSDFSNSKIFVYESNTGFSVLVDSFPLQPAKYDEGFIEYFGGEGILNDYKLMIDSSHTYYVDGFTTSNRVCNNCILGDDEVTQLASYNVNGQKYNGGTVVITK